MGEKHTLSNASHGVAGYCIVLGLAIAWQYFRGDFFARYLCFVVGDVSVEVGTLFYYAFLIALVLLATLHPVFHARLDRMLEGPISVPLLCSAAASPLLMLFANVCDGAAQVLLGGLSLVLVAVFITVSIVAWGNRLSGFDPRRIAVFVTSAFVLSSLFSYYMFLPRPVVAALLVALPVLSAVLFRHLSTLDPPQGAPDVASVQQKRSDSTFAVLLALFCIAAFSVRGIVAPLEAANTTVEFAVVNAVNVAIGLLLLLVLRNVRSVDGFLNVVSVALMLAFFASLCLTVIVSSAAHFPIINSVTLVIRACLTYALYLTACLYAQRSTRSPSLTIGLVFLIPVACAQAIRGLLFSIDAIGAVYSSYVAPVLSLVLIAGVFVVLSPRQRESQQLQLDVVPGETPSSDSGYNGLPRGFEERFGLTPREAQIAACLSRGHTLQHTAEDLNISINTVRTHAKSLYRKAGIETKQQLIDMVENWDKSDK